MVSFSKCASTKKLQDSIPVEIGNAYCQRWVGGIQGGGSGIDLYIPIESSRNIMVFDSVYFRGKQTKLELDNETVFIGRFKTENNQKEDIIMSSEPHAEYGNKVPAISGKIPFELEDSECVVSYKEGKKIKYFKITGIKEKKMIAYPSAPPKNE